MWKPIPHLLLFAKENHFFLRFLSNITFKKIEGHRIFCDSESFSFISTVPFKYPSIPQKTEKAEKPLGSEEEIQSTRHNRSNQ
jgi:hypothetical protein